MARAKKGKVKSSEIVSLNPATGEALGSVKNYSAEEVQDAVDRARDAQRAWAAFSFRARKESLLRLRQVIVDHTDELCERISKENGKTLQEALMMEVLPTVDLLTYFAKRAEKVLSPKKISLHLFKHRSSYVHYVPRGVIGIIAPWNFPFAIPMGESIMAFLSGNAVVLKPSEVTPLIAVYAKELFEKAGMPKDLFQVVTGGGATGQALIDSGIDMMFFTGSVATGKRVAEACGARLIPCVTELGGKAPAIVCPDADLERTANALTWGGFANSGQVCASVERVYVPESVHDELLDRVVKKTKTLRQLNPNSFTTDVGAICFPRQIDVAQDLIEDAVNKGAKIRIGGSLKEGEEMFFQPTVLEGVTQDMRIVREEIFGPILPFVKVKDVNEAIHHANDSHLGLSAYVFTKDRARGRQIAELIESGTVMVNDVMATYGMPETPWQGVKESGVGFVHTDDGLRHMCESRHVHYDRLSPFKKEPWWYPYSEARFSMLKKFMKLLFGRS